MFPTIEGASRPNAPQEWRHVRCFVNLVWHHVIPFSVLRDVWNRLVTAGRLSQEAESRLALRQYLALCGMRSGEADVAIDRLRAGTLERHECDSLGTVAAWPSWNIVEGPDSRCRLDDPGEDYMDRYTHGLTVREFERMRAMESLIVDFVAFGRLAGNPSVGSLRVVRDAMMLARPSLPCEGPIPFREDMWERDSFGRWKKRRSGERFIGP